MSVSDKIYRPVSYTVPLCQSVTRGIATWIVYLNICQRQSIRRPVSSALLPGISVSNPGYSGLSLEVYTRISVSDRVYEDLYPDISVSNLGYTLGVYRSTGISVSDKVYEDLSATLFPGVSVSNPGYNDLSPETGISVSDKVYENLSDIVY